MTNTLFILLYSPLIVLTLVLLIACLQKYKLNPFVGRCILFCFILLGWQVCELMVYLVPDRDVIRYVVDLKLIFIAYIAVVIFMMVAAFYRLDRWFPWWLLLGVLTIPTITAALAVTSPLHGLLMKQFEVTVLSPMIELVCIRTGWFYVHALYSQVLIAGIAVMVIRNYKRLPRAYRGGTPFMVISLIFYFVCSTIEICGLDKGYPLDFTLISTAICGFMFYLALLANGKTDYLQIERREIFNYLDEGILILDQNGRIIDMNQTARKLLLPAGADIAHITFKDFLNEQCEAGRIIKKRYGSSRKEDLILLTEMYPQVYEIKGRVIKGGEDQYAGRYIILTNVTNNRLFMERLRVIAGVDLLTGLPNRYRYQELLRELDCAKNLPLSIIMGDVNDLKEVNDTYGHYEGDSLLRVAGETLMRCCPENGYVARIGGDEFIMLLPICPKSKAAAIIEEIRYVLRNNPTGSHAPEIAFGYATKTDPSENISFLINEADQRMYRDKRGHLHRMDFWKEGGQLE